MLSFTNIITIEKSLSEVFAFVSDQRNNPKWNYYITDVEKTNTAEGVGTEYLQIRKSDKQRLGIVVFKSNKSLVVQTLPGQRPPVRRKLIFEGDEDKTTIFDQFDFLLPVPRFLSSMMLKGPRKAVKQNLEKLKILLESGHVILQDGRSVTL